MNSQKIINDLLAQGQESMTPAIQERMIDIITGKYIYFLTILCTECENSHNIKFLVGLRAGTNPEDDPVSRGAVLETSLRQLLVLCHEHNDDKSFTAEQYAFLHGYLAAMLAMKGKLINILPRAHIRVQKTWLNY